MYKKHPLKAAIASAVLASSLSSAVQAAPVKVDINSNIKHSVNGVSNFGRERRIMIHANSTENDFIGEKEKFDYLMELGVHFGRDAGLSMYYFSQTTGDPEKSTPADSGDVFPYGYADVHSSESLSQGAEQYYYGLETKYEDAKEYFGRNSAMMMASQPKPAFPNWSSYSWFGGGLLSDEPWRPRTMEQAGEWYAQFLNDFFLQREVTLTLSPCRNIGKW